MWSHQIYLVVSCHLTKFQVFLISRRTGWTKNGIKGQTLVRCGAEGVVALQLWSTGHAWRFSEFFFDNNVCDMKRCTCLKGFLKTSSKSWIIKLLVNLRSDTPHLPVNHCCFKNYSLTLQFSTVQILLTCEAINGLKIGQNTVFWPGNWKKMTFKMLLLEHRMTILLEKLH